MFAISEFHRPCIQPRAVLSKRLGIRDWGCKLLEFKGLGVWSVELPVRGSGLSGFRGFWASHQHQVMVWDCIFGFKCGSAFVLVIVLILVDLVIYLYRVSLQMLRVWD